MPDPSEPASDSGTVGRFERPRAFEFCLGFSLFVFLVWSLERVGVSVKAVLEGLPNMAKKVDDMTPPDFERVQPVLLKLLETLQIAFVGTVAGILISLVLAVFAAQSTSPHPFLRMVVRGFISFLRTVPDLVWAIFFVASVGLGPFAGTLTIMVDTIGFCGRFFAEGMDETEKGPQDALKALGAKRSAVIFAAIYPACIPSFTNTSSFALEKAVRSSVVLGLVGAGGIGIELKVAMDFFAYQQACTIILCIFILVLAVEQLSLYIRNRSA
ncbi:MAG: phosphonate ABC transporter, permease protein PhnE [Verrucomicrobiales bacterium]